jgi:hypothetical protein
MKALCKKYYPYDENDAYSMSLQSYFTGRTYNTEKIFHENEFWFIVIDEWENEDLFAPNEFEEYFYDIAKLRKEKLNKIIENYE